MAETLQLRRGTTADHTSFTGAEGEVTVDTTLKTLRVHDNTTAGGTVLAKDAEVLKNTGATVTTYLSDVLSTAQVRNISVGSTMPSNPKVGDIHFII